MDHSLPTTITTISFIESLFQLSSQQSRFISLLSEWKSRISPRASTKTMYMSKRGEENTLLEKIDSVIRQITSDGTHSRR